MEEALSWFVMKAFNLTMYITCIVCIVGFFVLLRIKKLGGTDVKLEEL